MFSRTWFCKYIDSYLIPMGKGYIGCVSVFFALGWLCREDERSLDNLSLFPMVGAGDYSSYAVLKITFFVYSSHLTLSSYL